MFCLGQSSVGQVASGWIWLSQVRALQDIRYVPEKNPKNILAMEAPIRQYRVNTEVIAIFCQFKLTDGYGSWILILQMMINKCANDSFEQKK